MAADETHPATAAELAADTPASWERRQPAWQQWVNQFCENWIFALLIAMLVRHFFLEAYRIPSASMEPMLYGDKALSKGDFVLVDKFIFRFTGPERWGVTVFQFPSPEIAGPGGPNDPRPAFDGAGERIDHVVSRPLLNRNFVKRCVGLPGDVFFLRGGDYFLQGDDGSFAVSQKPADLIERLWFPIYRFGAQPGYLPWRAEGAAQVAAVDGGLQLRFSDPAAELVFTQPLRNLYVKEGDIRVALRDQDDRREFDALSLLAPQFPWDGNMQGNLWDLDIWDVYRVTTENLDSANYGSKLNHVMKEYVSDLRIVLRLAALPSDETTRLQLRLQEGSGQGTALELQGGGWRLLYEGKELHRGELPSGATVALVSIDDRIWVEVDGQRQHQAEAIAANDPSLASGRPRLSFSGGGSVQLTELHIQRDVHYNDNGITADENREWADYTDKLKRATQSLSVVGPAALYEVQLWQVKLQEIVRNRRIFIENLVDEEQRTRLLAELERAEAGQTRSRWAWLEPLAHSAETAVRIPDDAYLLLGDNSPHSLDGRNWGFVPAVNLRGEVLFSANLRGRFQVVR